MTGQVARLGFMYLMQFTAMLSLNLAVLNILPIPALDGGRLLFVIIGKIMRRPVTPKIEQWAHVIGFMFLMLIVILATGKDLNVVGWVQEVWQKVF
jgi:regulator of sigma E protease